MNKIVLSVRNDIQLHVFHPDKVPCSAVNCLNGATCRDTDVGVGHICECVAGYTGDTCETGMHYKYSHSKIFGKIPCIIAVK